MIPTAQCVTRNKNASTEFAQPPELELRVELRPGFRPTLDSSVTMADEPLVGQSAKLLPMLPCLPQLVVLNSAPLGVCDNGSPKRLSHGDGGG